MQMSKTNRRTSLLMAGAWLGLSFQMGMAAEPAQQHDSQAVRLNNDGVALMNQQQTDRAQAAFAAALQKDPKLAQAALNDGIALLYLQKLPEAQAALKTATSLDPKDPQAWYNLGLVQRAGNDVAAALTSFQHAVEFDPADADSYYFEGVCLQDEKQSEQAIAVFKKALEVNPQHASSEFALARVLQRTGHADEAKAHFVRFQHLTSTKVSSALGLSYGDQGRYSTAVPVAEASAQQKPMIPVRFAKVAIGGPGGSAASGRSGGKEALGGGACVLDVDGDGLLDLVLMRQGDAAIHVMRNRGNGSFSEVNAQSAGLGLSGHAVSCAVGDYDGDGLPDLAVALEDRVVLFHNKGHGQFEDVTQAAGLAGRNRPAGISFVDYDHDGDLDLFITGAGLKQGDAPNVLWRNNGNRTFTEWTDQVGLGGTGETRAVILSDVNNDRAVDLAVTGDGKSPLVYMNPREGKYPVRALYENADLPATNGVAVLDFNKDGWMDIAVTHAGAPGVTLWRNREG